MLLTSPVRRSRCERLEPRTLLTITLSGVPIWSEQGPGPVVNGSVAGIANGTVAGAVNRVAVDPGNPNRMFIATVSGGIWGTTNATAASPVWTPMTDRSPSLSFSAISMSPLDSNVIYAGAARFSSGPGAHDGGPRIGVLKTVDGGLHWTNLGRDVFGTADLNLDPILATPLNTPQGQVVLAGTLGPDASNGIYRSSDGGTSWTRISGAAATADGLDNDADGATDEPGELNLPAGSVTSIVGDPSNANRYYAGITAQGIFRTVNGGSNWVKINTNIPVALTGSLQGVIVGVHNSSGNNVVYVGMFNNAAGFGNPSVYRSTNQGGSWIKMDDPGAVGRGGFAPDPNDPNVIFMSGGANGSTNRGVCFRGDASKPAGLQWESAVEAGANNTAMHADGRGSAFDSNGDLIECDDGGIYRLENPNNNPGDPRPRKWKSVNGNLRNFESYSVAYDALNNRFFAGFQDNGVGHQINSGDFSWDDLDQGDGTAQAAAPFGGNTLRYSMGNVLKNFRRRTFNSSNVKISDLPVHLASAPGNPDGSGLNASDLGQSFDGPHPVALNANDPMRLLLGRTGLYESINNSGGDVITDISAPNMGNVTALAYGGTLGGVPNFGVMYVGAGDKLYFRNSGAGAPAELTTYTGSAVVDIALDREDWRRAFVLDDAGRVWRTTDAGATAGNWTDLTANLHDLYDVSDIQSIEFYRNGSTGDEAIIAGGLYGVFRAINPTTPANTIWTQYGTRLPNTIVRDLHYDTSDDLLYVGTYGRGVWNVYNASATLTTLPVLQITGDAAFDTVRLVRDAADPAILDVFLNNTTATPSAAFLMAGLTRIDVSTFGGIDLLILDQTNGPVVVPEGIVYDGGASMTRPGDALQVIGQQGDETYTVTNSQVIVISNTDFATSFVNYTNVLGITLDAGGGSDTVDVIATGAGATLTINGGGENDTINVAATLGFGSPTFDNIDGTIIVNGQAGSDTLNFRDNGATSAQSYTLTATTLDRSGAPQLTYGTVETLTLRATSSADLIIVSETAAASPLTIVSSPGNDTVNVNTDAIGLASVIFNATQRIGALSIGTGGTARIATGGNRVLTLSSLSIPGSGKLDLTDEDLIVDYTAATPIATVQSLLASGYASGAWNGAGIDTSLGSASTFSLGYAEASDVAPSGVFSGQPVDATAVVVKYTYYGDASLDGKVDVTDLGRLATNWQLSPRRWAQGNFNYDAIVDVSDLGKLATNWQAGVGMPLGKVRAKTIATDVLRDEPDAL